MNPTMNVNIGGYPFIIDENAYIKLEDYLDIIAHHFSTSDGCNEIVHDIELRFAELLNENSSKRSIINLSDIQRVIKILGTPEEFGAEDVKFQTDQAPEGETGHAPSIGKRLFRNPDDKVIAGVCSGLAAYLGVNDPVWLRLGFVVFVMIGGAGVLLYLLLIIAVPKAKTPMDKLAMKGKPINIQSIANQIEEGINNLTYTIDEMSDRWSSKKKR